MPYTKKLSYIEKLKRMTQLMASCSVLTEELRQLKEITDSLAAEVKLTIDWETFAVKVGDKRTQPKSEIKPVTTANTEIVKSPKLLCGHPLPWRATYNGCVYFIMDANDECVATHSNKELIQILLDKSKEEFTGE